MKPIIYTASCGENITESVRESLKLSIRKGRDVKFTFNGIDMVVNAKVSKDASHWTKVYYDATDELSKRYRQSDEYKEPFTPVKEERPPTVGCSRCDGEWGKCKHSDGSTEARKLDDNTMWFELDDDAMWFFFGCLVGLFSAYIIGTN